MKNILFIHQSAELYGSDKTLLLLIKNLDKSKFYPIVILPNEGPLKKELENESIKVVIAPVLKLYRKMFSPKNLLGFLQDFQSGFLVLRKLNKEYKFDIIYSNTLAVLLGFFFAKKNNINHVWHVHEIIESPKLIRKIFSYLIASKTNNVVVFNSNATAVFWKEKSKKTYRSEIVWNGLEIFKEKLSDVKRIELKKELFNSRDNEIIIGLVGRISRWKGQQLLLKSFKKLNKENIRLVFIGSPPPNQDEFLIELNDNIKSFKLIDKVQIIPFQEKIHEIWQLIDIAVVPSIEPEPFGLVAVEAMLANKPVIAANHGGLTEIVVNNETGILFKPSDVENLSNALGILIDSEELRIKYGIKGFERALNNFTVESYSNKIQNILQNI
ncbi:glycosyltransferase family 4 protein [Flavobacterium sp.]|uniref:glycosyltransferase family 4 protein n=1 Tax=Flavobacterium sp. TaxID=239 RepID=UPI003D287CA5